MDVSQEAGVGRAAQGAAAAAGIVLLTLASAQFLMTLDSSVTLLLAAAGIPKVFPNASR